MQDRHQSRQRQADANQVEIDGALLGHGSLEGRHGDSRHAAAKASGGWCTAKIIQGIGALLPPRPRPDSHARAYAAIPDSTPRCGHRNMRMAARVGGTRRAAQGAGACVACPAADRIDRPGPEAAAGPRSPDPCSPGVFHHEETPPRRGDRRRRPDRLQPAVPDCQRPDARRRSARDPAAARAADRQGAGRAQGRDDGDRGLRLPAARRNERQRRRDAGVQGRRHRAPGRRAAARAGHGAQGPAARERQDLHRAGQGARRRGQPWRQGARRGQPGQHQRLYRDEVRAVAAAQELHRHASARPQSGAVAARGQGGGSRSARSSA